MRNWIVFSLLGVVLAPVGFIAIRNFLDQQHYDRGTEAYEQGKCDVALSELKPFLIKDSEGDDGEDQVARAKAIEGECDLFKSISTEQQQNKLDAALDASAQFAQRYPSSPLMSQLRQTTVDLFRINSMGALAKPTSCQQFELIQQHNLVPQMKIPQFYQACGRAFENNKNYAEAISIYENFLDQFPKHALTKNIKQAYAQTLYAQAQSKGAGTIPSPASIGSTGDGSTVVEIRNDSPEKMRIVFGGPTPRVEELPPCSDCKTYIEKPPKACPGKGPVGSYTVEPGRYRVVVKSIGGHTVIPYTGDWGMSRNTLYSHCFYIVESPLGSPPPSSSSLPTSRPKLR